MSAGIEVTTGPLGQGFANAVGLAIGQAHLGATFNKENFPLIDNYTYSQYTVLTVYLISRAIADVSRLSFAVFTGDGCLQEGVASEAASLAGHLQLGNLIAVYDDNHITIDGDTNVSFTEDVEKRFEAYGWEVIHVANGDADLSAIAGALAQAKKSTDKPTIIRLTTTIGFGSKLQGTHGVHGAPLKKEDVVSLKEKFGLDPNAFFSVPQTSYDLYKEVAAKGADLNSKWDKLFADYQQKYPTEGAELARRIAGDLPEGWEKHLPVYKMGDAAVGSRKYSEVVLEKLAAPLPELVGGSADLTGSNFTRWTKAVDFQPPQTKLGDYSGRYIRYGVREHAMGAIMNGLHAYGAIVPFGGTFLNFVSYAAGAVRLSALSNHQVIWVATHDSIGLGEDGPTHQPVETVAWLRALPNCAVWRPADGNETSAAYLVALKSKQTPSVLCLSRQNLPQLENSTLENASKGGYVVHEDKAADVTLVSTGSEVAIVVEAVEILAKKGIKARVVSLPCWEVFEEQPAAYKLSILPSGAPVMSVEAYNTFGWAKYSHEHFGLDGFGASGPYLKVYDHFEMNGEGVSKRAEKVVKFYKGRKIDSPLISALNEVRDI